VIKSTGAQVYVISKNYSLLDMKTFLRDSGMHFPSVTKWAASLSNGSNEIGGLAGLAGGEKAASKFKGMLPSSDIGMKVR
jgi:hypothetical protein